jgi:hypothetical protein
MEHTIEGDSVELVISDGGITDTGKMNNSSSSRLSVLVVHESPLLERSNFAGEDELEIPNSFVYVVGEVGEVMRRELDEKSGGGDC